MIALVEEHRAELTFQEAEVPKAVAEAIDQGHLGAMEYYRLRNIQADTLMRSSFAGASEDRSVAGQGSS